MILIIYDDDDYDIAFNPD